MKFVIKYIFNKCDQTGMWYGHIFYKYMQGSSIKKE